LALTIPIVGPTLRLGQLNNIAFMGYAPRRSYSCR